MSEKRVLLVNPSTTHLVKNSSPFKETPLPPLGLLYLATYVKQNSHHQIKICDMEIGDSLDKYLIDYKPQIVGMYAITFNWYDVLHILSRIKKFDKTIQTVIGGPHADIYPEQSIKFKQIDNVIRGDGEISFLELLSGRSEAISEERVIHNLDELSYPDRDLINIRRYNSLMSGVFTTNMIASRNCPSKCIFCYQPRPYRFRSAGNIFGEMQVLNNLGVKDIIFHDDTFTWSRDRTMELCDRLIYANMGITWNVRTRIDKVDKKLLIKMKKAGCTKIKYGVESGSDLVLNSLNKKICTSQTEQTIKWTKEANMESEAYVILGSPGETENQMKETINFVNRRLHPDYVLYYLAAPMPNTKLYDMTEKKVDYWEQFVINPSPVFFLRFWNSDLKLLAKMWKRATYSFYLRPIYIINRILKIRSMKSFILQSHAFLILLFTMIRRFDEK